MEKNDANVNKSEWNPKDNTIPEQSLLSLKTREQIIAEVFGWEKFSAGPVHCETSDFLEAMRIYAAQLKEENERLREAVTAADNLAPTVEKLFKGLATDGTALEGFVDAYEAYTKYAQLRFQNRLTEPALNPQKA